MKIGVVIICRFNSTRLHGKILKEINGKPILGYIIETLLTIFDKSDLVIATSNEKSDNIIEKYCNDKFLKCYRGDLMNVSKRFLDASLNSDFDYSIRINGDNLFLDKDLIYKLIQIAKNGDFDFISNVKGRTFPKGMSVEVVKIETFKKAINEFTDPDDFEHVTKYIYENEEKFNCYYHYNHRVPQAAGIQLAIDTIEDFEVASKILEYYKGNHTELGLEELFNIKNEVENND